MKPEIPESKRPVRKKLVRKHTDLEVYQRSFTAAMHLFQLTQKFPAEERFSLSDQVRRSSRSVSANLAEGWRKRRYPAAFAAKLSDCEGEAAETQTWIQFAVECGYLKTAEARPLYKEYDEIIAMLVAMNQNVESWKL